MLISKHSVKIKIITRINFLTLSSQILIVLHKKFNYNLGIRRLVLNRDTDSTCEPS